MYGGGKGMGGGRVFKVLSRSVARAGVSNLPETVSSSSAATSPTALSRSKQKLNSPNNLLTLSSASPFSGLNAPVSAGNGGANPPSWPYFPSDSCDCDEYEWISVDGGEEMTDDGFLGPVPSLDEVHGAVSALTQAFDASSYSQFVKDKYSYSEENDASDSPGSMHHVSPAGSYLDWEEPSLHLCNSRMLHTYGPDRVYDAFHLLQSDPTIQRMVISLSSDKAVWDAVLNNDVVRELRDSYNADAVETITPPASEDSNEAREDSNPTMNVVKWIFQNTMAKFMEIMDNMAKMLGELFKPPTDEKKSDETTDTFEDKLRTSFLLSVVVLLIVVVSRANTA